MGERVTCPACGRHGVPLTITGKMRKHYIPNGITRGPECLAAGRRLYAPRRRPAPRPTILTFHGETYSTYGLVERSPWECWTPRPGWAVRAGPPEHETCPAPTPEAP